MENGTAKIKCNKAIYAYVSFSPNILNIQYISPRNGKNKVSKPPKKPASLNAMITVQMCVIIAVMANTPNSDTKLLSCWNKFVFIDNHTLIQVIKGTSILINK